MKQIPIPNQLLLFEDESPGTLAAAQARLPALACSKFNIKINGAKNREVDRYYPGKKEKAGVMLPFEMKQIHIPSQLQPFDEEGEPVPRPLHVLVSTHKTTT